MEANVRAKFYGKRKCLARSQARCVAASLTGYVNDICLQARPQTMRKT